MPTCCRVCGLPYRLVNWLGTFAERKACPCVEPPPVRITVSNKSQALNSSQK